MSTESTTRMIVFEMVDFGCPSCAHAIERFGRRRTGVADVRVDLATREIRMRYDGNPDSVRALLDYVRMIGHEVRIRNPLPAGENDAE